MSPNQQRGPSLSYPVFAYNATKSSPREVASTFVQPDAFVQLRDARNAILVGPRGSGKTTLLKMLTAEALEYWDGEDAVLARERVQDVGVFVGVDAMWSEQIRSARSSAFGAAAYALHIARAFTRTLLYRVGRAPSARTATQNHLRISLSKHNEATITRRAARLYKLPEEPTSLSSLDVSIGDRLSELGSYRERPDSLPDWGYVDPIQSVSELVQMVNDAVDQPDTKWALLFDELELAPQEIVSSILRRLRGAESYLIFKISMAPILRSMTGLVGASGATDGQDVEYIPLTNARRTDGFVRALLERDVQQHSWHGGAPLNMVDLLGESIFGTDTNEAPRTSPGSQPYRRGSKLWNSLDRLRDKDASFSAYLDDKRIDLRNLGRTPPAQRAASLRKIRNIVVVREYFWNSPRIDTQRTRSLYAGANSIAAFPDGNPRMSTILVRELAAALIEAETPPLSIGVQAAAIDVVTTRFLALLYAQEGVRSGSRAVTLVHIIDAIGTALHRKLLEKKFSSDVPAGFYVDSGFPTRFLPLLSQAVNTGAFVHIPRLSSAAPVADSTVGRHYRLSYLLAPRYGLPIRLGKTVALSRLLQEVRIGSTGISGQSALPGLEE